MDRLVYYYSTFVHQIFNAGPDLFSAMEIVYSMALTNSPTGFVVGMEDAIADTTTDTNLVLRFINGNVNRFGCVSGGGHTRRQVSHQGYAHKMNIYKSLHNMLALIEFANSNDDTDELLKRCASSTENGGMFLVGVLTAQEMINVLTKVGIITNTVHADNAKVGIGTKTHERLHSMGIRSDVQKEALMNYLMNDLQLSRVMVENAICESLRMRFNTPGRRFFDTIDTNSYIYTMEEDRLFVFDVNGIRVDAPYPIWDTTNEDELYQGVRWWLPNYEDIYADEIVGKIRLTTNV